MIKFAALSHANPIIDVGPHPNGPELWDAILAELPGGAIVAGGAVRDYLLGVEPKDIDVFIAANKFMNPAGFHELGEDKDAEYGAMSEICVVTRGVVADRQVDLVGVDYPNVSDMIERFDFGVARCWYDGELHDTPEAAADRANKTVTLFLDDRLERSRARFARFNERMGGDWRLIDDFQV